VQEPADVLQLHERLRELGYRPEQGPFLVLKIETLQAIRRFPALCVAAGGTAPAAVMIARGDLAVEIGFMRMAEMQEELLWLSEAAQLPAIWATQVLENLTKHGVPSRAEISDASMSVRAEAVMLNKGPYLPEAVETLDTILSSMQSHHHHKMPLLRALRSWKDE
jgi:pyruvate kinase